VGSLGLKCVSKRRGVAMVNIASGIAVIKSWKEVCMGLMRVRRSSEMQAWKQMPSLDE